MLKKFLAAIVFVIVVSCTQNITGGPGNGSETTNGIVYCAEGKPVSGAVVRLIDEQNWLERNIMGLSVVLDSTVTDSSGLFGFNTQYTRKTNIQIDWEQEGLLHSFRNQGYENHVDTFRLSRYAQLSGRFSAETTAHGLALAGTAFIASVGEDGEFSIPGIPSGAFSLVALFENSAALCGVYQFYPGLSTDIAEIAADTSKIRVDRFTSGFGPADFWNLTGGLWYPFSSRDSYTNVEIVTDSNKSVLHAELIRSSQITSYAGIGFQVGKSSNTYFNFSDLNSLSFRAKGSGVIHVSIQTRAIEEANGPWPQFYKEISLTPEWKHWEIDVDSLTMPHYAPAYHEGYTWGQVADRVNRVEFTNLGTVSDSVYLNLSDVYLKGLDLKALVPQK
ncbi:hypothetical protein QA601_17420 [Chitinispirillales bacterium ANBcel5]|uniref:hypothetical protein n=1 Tax=Cellulosispirillum alkaliphilum TaxID=3039283 RepID=UPI002A4E65FD|nr:hypothetical protein [Chitinispirillales bacterium ANBcel5]